MGLGGYLAARSDAEHYEKEQETEQREIGGLAAAAAFGLAKLIP